MVVETMSHIGKSTVSGMWLVLEIFRASEGKVCANLYPSITSNIRRREVLLSSSMRWKLVNAVAMFENNMQRRRVVDNK